MILNEMFGKSNLNAIRYSKYDVYTKDGEEWVAPAPNAAIVSNIALDEPERLLLDALNTGRVQYVNDYPDEFKREILLSFVRCYGLLSKDNAERIDWIKALLTEFFTHFSTTKMCEYTDDPAVREGYAKLVSRYQLRDLAIGIEVSPIPDENGRCNPVLVWDFNSLRQAVETLYIMAITHPEINLRMCKHCGAAFIAHHGRSEFCGDRCRNQYNVYKWREREKEKKK